MSFVGLLCVCLCCYPGGMRESRQSVYSSSSSCCDSTCLMSLLGRIMWWRAVVADTAAELWWLPRFERYKSGVVDSATVTEMWLSLTWRRRGRVAWRSVPSFTDIDQTSCKHQSPCMASSYSSVLRSTTSL